MENKKEGTSFKRITTPQIIIITIFIIGTFVFLILSKTSNTKSQELMASGTIQSVGNTNVIETSTQPIIDSALKDPVLNSNFVCPQNYLSEQAKDEAMTKFVTDYLKEFPKSSASDTLIYLYSMLVKNDCKETLDYIKTQAKGEDPLTFYIKKTLEFIGQNKGSSNNEINTEKEKTTAEIVAEWEDRVVEVTCVFKEDKGLMSAQGSATLTNLTDIDGSVIMVAITNAHVLSDNGYTPSACVLGIYGKGSRTVNYTSGSFLQGTLEDYGYINLNKASKIEENTWKSVADREMKNCSNSNINLGDNIVVLGYPGIGTKGGLTVTKGIISGIEKNYYVTDTKIDHGNSGGAAILLKDDCYLGIPSASAVGEMESMGRILKASFVIVD